MVADAVAIEMELALPLLPLCAFIELLGQCAMFVVSRGKDEDQVGARKAVVQQVDSLHFTAGYCSQRVFPSSTHGSGWLARFAFALLDQIFCPDGGIVCS